VHRRRPLYIEQDVQLTADGALVVLHDATLDRTMRGPAANCTGVVAAKTLAQLRTCDAGSWFNETYPGLARPEYVGKRIPTLGQVFGRYGASTNYHIETKPSGDGGQLERRLVQLIQKYELYDAAAADWKVLIQSFLPHSLETIHALAPDLPLVQLIGAEAGTFGTASFDYYATYAVGVGPSYDLVDAAYVSAAHARCLVVHPWTVNQRATMSRLIDLGVDGMFTNVPGVLNQVLERNRQNRPDAAALSAAAHRACA